MQPVTTVHTQTAGPTQKQPHTELWLQSLVAELVPPAGHMTPGIRRWLALNPRLDCHFAALQLHHALIVPWAVLEETQVPAQQSDLSFHVDRHQRGALNTIYTRAGACPPVHLLQLPEPGGVVLVVEAGQEDEGGGRALVLSRVSIT